MEDRDADDALVRLQQELEQARIERDAVDQRWGPFRSNVTRLLRTAEPNNFAKRFERAFRGELNP